MRIRRAGEDRLVGYGDEVKAGRIVRGGRLSRRRYENFEVEK